MGGAYQILIEDMDYWIIDDVDVANFVNNGVLVSAKTRDSTGCQLKNMTVSNQSINTSIGAKWWPGYHTVSVGGDPYTTATGTLRNFTADNVNVYGGYPVTGEAAGYYNEVFTVFGDCDGVTIKNCSVNQSRSGIAFNCLGAGVGNFSWRPGQPHNVTFQDNVVVDLQNHSNICNAFYADRPGANCVWDGNFAINVKTLFGWGYEPGSWANGTTRYGNGTFKNNRGVIQLNGIYGGVTGTGMEIGSYDEYNVQSSGSIDVYNNVLVFKDISSWPNGIQIRRCIDADIYNNVVYLHSVSATGDYSGGISFTGYHPANTYGSDWVYKYDNNQYYSAAGGGSWALPAETYTGSIDVWNSKTSVSGEYLKEPLFKNINGSTYADFEITNGGPAIGEILSKFSYTKSGLTVYFTDESTTNAADGIETYAWDFDLDNEGTDTDTVADPTNVYGAAGTYRVQLTVTSDEGTDSSEQQVSVSATGSGSGSLAEQIGASGDDIETNASGRWETAINYCSIGDLDATSYDGSAGLRFTLSGAIPSDAEITAANIELYAVWKYTGLPTARIRAEDAANPGSWSNRTDYTGRTLTTEYADWNISTWTIGQWYTSSDFRDVIQELVDSYSGLASGAHINIHVDDASSGWGGTNTSISFESYDGSTTNAPKLNIEWDTPATASNDGPLLLEGFNQGFLDPFSLEMD
jgi:PKD repeat protein